MQHIWKALLTSLLIFALAATACLAEDSEAQYQAYSYTTFNLRRTPSESDRGISVQKKTKILILEWDDAWCKVQVGNKVGYAKPEWLYRVQSLDALHYPLQNLPHRMSGYVEFSQDTLISGGKFKGCTASAGQIACVEAQADGAYLLPVWRGEMQLTDEIGTYHPFADWETAEPGDIIGGFTTFYGDQQGQGKARQRRASTTSAKGSSALTAWRWSARKHSPSTRCVRHTAIQMAMSLRRMSARTASGTAAGCVK